jgi:hypothetical protein
MDSEPFEWYQRYSDIKEILKKYIIKNKDIEEEEELKEKEKNENSNQ